MKDYILKASFKECPIDERDFFSKSHGMLLISVGQKYHEDEKLEATIELVSKKFKKCTIMVCDTLQRHNLFIENPLIDKLQAFSICFKYGEEWISRNKKFIDKFTIPTEIIRWNYWLENPKFDDAFKKIVEKYQTDNLYKNAVDYSIDEFLLRRKDKILDRDFSIKCCLDYLLEECAAMLLWIDCGYNYEIYPNKRNSAMEATFNKFISHYGNILKPVSLRFKKYSNFLFEINKKELEEYA